MDTTIKSKLRVCICLIAIIGLLIVSAYAWGDSDGGRPSYTLEEINSDVLGDAIVLNSISDSTIGNEKNFVGVREYNGPNTSGKQNVWNGNEITAKNGQEYIIRIYVHNNNLHSENAAEDVRTYFRIPTEASRCLRVNGFITTSNASPSKYWDYVDFVSDTPFHLEYVYGSALLENNGVGAKGLQLSDEIVTSLDGVLIGYYDYGDGTLDGIIPGCYQYSSYITIRVKTVFDTNFSVESRVRLDGQKDTSWKDTVEADIGDTVEFQIQYTNMSDENQMDVAVMNMLPEGLRYITGSTRIINSEYPDGAQINEDSLTTTGFLIGSYGPDANAILTFKAEVTGEGLYEENAVLESLGRIDVGSRIIQDSASVIVRSGVKPESDFWSSSALFFLLLLAVICIGVEVILAAKSRRNKKP